MTLLVALLLAACLGATETLDEFGIPAWILPGLLAAESSSYYRADGTIHVTNRQVGSAGELGCLQVCQAAFNIVAQRGETFSRLAADSAFSEIIAARYLHYLYRKHGSWVNAIQAYNAGRPCPAGRRYLNRIYAITKDIR